MRSGPAIGTHACRARREGDTSVNGYEFRPPPSREFFAIVAPDSPP